MTNKPTPRRATPKPTEEPTEAPAFTTIPYYSLESVSKLIDVPVRTLYKWRLQGSFPRAVKTPGGRLLVRADWLEEWMATFERDLPPGASR